MSNPHPPTGFHMYSPEKRAEIHEIANRRRTEEAHKRKKLKQLLKVALSLPSETGKPGVTKFDDITEGLISKAIAGDVNAYMTIAKMIDEAPSDKIELATPETIKITLNKKSND